MDEKTHSTYMRLAIQQAQLAMDNDETPAGCIIINTTRPSDTGIFPVIGRAYNQTETLKDPTAHAEMIAITQAASAIGDWRLTNTILYTTKEPCVMCSGAIILARIPIVVFGTPDTRRGGAASVFNILNHPALNHQCTVIQGILEEECRAMLQSFFREKRSK